MLFQIMGYAEQMKERPPTPGGFSFALLPLVEGLIFSHRLRATETPTERRHRYALITLHHQTNERHTESHGERPSERPKHHHRTAHTGPAAPTPGGRGAEKDRHRQSRKRSKFGSMSVKISPVKISKFAVKI